MGPELQPLNRPMGSRGLPLHTPQFWGCLIQERLMNHFRPASERCCDRQGHQGSQFGLLRDKSVLVLLVLQGAGEAGWP